MNRSSDLQITAKIAKNTHGFMKKKKGDERLMSKITMILKIAGLALNVGGMILSGIAKDRSDKQLLEIMVKDHFENQN